MLTPRTREEVSVSERFGRQWTKQEVAKLKGLAGNYSTAEIAQELGRRVGATIAKASELHISLRKKRTFGVKGKGTCSEPGPAGMDLS
jgi:hypothetical protein